MDLYSLTRPRKLFLLLRMAVWTAVLTVAARVRPLPRALKVVEPRRRAALPASPEELARLMDRFLRRVDPSCWKRAAVLRRYLLRGGIETTIVFGVRRNQQGKLDGHAWLERDGRAYLEARPPEFTETFRYPDHGRDARGPAPESTGAR